MIRIDKPVDIPLVLTTKGTELNEANCKKYSSNPKLYKSGKEEFIISDKVYNDKSVKPILKQAQNNKCCYCEKDQEHEDGAVEHYRPKKGFQIKKGDKLIRPGYYWLGYDWSNLFFVCTHCNRKKSTIFPLKDEKKRALYHKKSIKNEAPYLLDPCGVKNPREHIIFKSQLIEGTSEYGKYTIEICDLDRDDLNNKRLKVISDIKARLVILKTSKDKIDINDAIKYTQNAISSKGEFSAMAIDYIESKEGRTMLKAIISPYSVKSGLEGKSAKELISDLIDFIRKSK